MKKYLIGAVLGFVAGVGCLIGMALLPPNNEEGEDADDAEPVLKDEVEVDQEVDLQEDAIG